MQCHQKHCRWSQNVGRCTTGTTRVHPTGDGLKTLTPAQRGLHTVHLKRTAGVLMIQKAQTMHDGMMHYCPDSIPDFEERKHMYGQGHRCRTDDGEGHNWVGDGGDGGRGFQRSP